eukprot:2275736-Heterocapsa_arctica.AAC.1
MGDKGQLHNFVNEPRLVCTNTFRTDAAGPIFSDGQGHLTRVDYILLPVDLLNSVFSMRLKHKFGYLLQRATPLFWIHHAPLELGLRYRDWHSSFSTEQQRWDCDLLRHATRIPEFANDF